MVVGLAKRSSRELRKFLVRDLGLSVGRCLDDFEFASLLRSINRRDRDDYWLLGWREHRVGNNSSVFTLTVIDNHNIEYLVRIYVSVGMVSMTIPTNQLNLTDEITGVTVLINGNTASLTGRVLCVTGISIRRIT